MARDAFSMATYNFKSIRSRSSRKWIPTRVWLADGTKVRKRKSRKSFTSTSRERRRAVSQDNYSRCLTVQVEEKKGNSLVSGVVIWSSMTHNKSGYQIQLAVKSAPTACWAVKIQEIRKIGLQRPSVGDDNNSRKWRVGADKQSKQEKRSKKKCYEIFERSTFFYFSSKSIERV